MAHPSSQSLSIRLKRGVRGAFVMAVGARKPRRLRRPLGWSARTRNGCPRTRARDIVPPGDRTTYFVEVRAVCAGPGGPVNAVARGSAGLGSTRGQIACGGRGSARPPSRLTTPAWSPESNGLAEAFIGMVSKAERLAHQPIGSDGARRDPPADALSHYDPSGSPSAYGQYRPRGARRPWVPTEDVLRGPGGIAISVCRMPLGPVLKAAFDDLNDAVRRGSHRFSSFFRAIYSISYRAHRLRLIQR